MGTRMLDDAPDLGFAYGEPASRFEWLTRGVSSLADLMATGRDPERPPLPLVLAKLAGWLACGTIALATGVAVVGWVAVRVWTAASG